jgi:hypothetical protein
MSDKKKWIVTKSGDSSLSEVKKKLTESGFTVEEVLDEIGCIRGTATESVAKKARAVPGVADVSAEPPPIDIGPPDSTVF